MNEAALSPSIIILAKRSRIKERDDKRGRSFHKLESFDRKPASIQSTVSIHELIVVGESRGLGDVMKDLNIRISIKDQRV